MRKWGSLGFIAAFGLILCVSAASSAAAAEDARLFRYAFEEGQKYVYELNIQIDLPETQETLTGLSKYQVKSIDAATGQITLIHSADLSRATRLTARGEGAAIRAMRGAGFSSLTFANFNSPCQVVIDADGKIVRYERKSQLPYLLGNIWAMTIEPLPPAGQKTWQAKRDLEIAEQETNGWFPRPRMNKQVNWSAKETIDYSIDDPAASAPVVARTYAMVTAEQVDDEPVVAMKGQGTLTYDSKAGMIRALDEKYTLRINDTGVTVKIPITITAKLLSAADAEKKMAERKAAAEQARRDVEESQKPKPIDDTGLDELLTSIKSSNEVKHHQGLQKLALSIPIEARRDEVASLLLGLLSEHDEWTVKEAEKALKLWGNDDCTAALIKLLDSHDVFVRMGAIDALAPRKSDEAAEAVARQLLAMNTRHQAGESLKAMGDVAEKPVLPLLKNPEWTVRLSACEILAAVGTSQSIDPLKAAATDGNGLVQMKAKEALKAIEARASKPKVEEQKPV